MPNTEKYATSDEIEAMIKALSSIKRSSVRKDIIEAIKVIATAERQSSDAER